MKVLVTGATGFIGKHLIMRFLTEDVKIVIIKHPKDKTELPPGVISYVFNYDDVEKDIAFLKGQKIGGVIHLASLFLTSHESRDIKTLIDTNLLLSTYVLECAVKAEIKWFLNTGTFWQHYNNADYSPVNLYAASKQAFEVIAKYYIDSNKIQFSTLKLSDTYGLNDTRPKILNLLEKISKSGETLNMSPGGQILDLSYIDDVINAYYKLTILLENDEIENGEYFAVKSNRRITLKELVEIFEKVTGKKLNINWGGRPYREREVMVPWETCNLVPGWTPEISLEQGIKLIHNSDIHDL